MEMTINNRFAILLAEKQIAEKRKISLQEVSDNTGISRRALYTWEKNTVTRFDIPIMEKLCEYFNVDPSALFHYIPNEKQESKPTQAKPRKVKKSA